MLVENTREDYSTYWQIMTVISTENILEIFNITVLNQYFKFTSEIIVHQAFSPQTLNSPIKYLVLFSLIMLFLYQLHTHCLN